jgi:DNA-binding XRE family transcriptional regulator
MANVKSMMTFKSFLAESMKDPEFRKEYDALEPEFALISLMIEKRIKEGLTQDKLAKKIGTKQSAISRFESGNYNPTIGFLYKVADALDADIKVTVTPRSKR